MRLTGHHKNHFHTSTSGSKQHKNRPITEGFPAQESRGLGDDFWDLHRRLGECLGPFSSWRSRPLGGLPFGLFGFLGFYKVLKGFYRVLYNLVGVSWGLLKPLKRGLVGGGLSCFFSTLGCLRGLL